ncbi:MAG: 50S ribosomal protein L25 [Calditrichia bacterium]
MSDAVIAQVREERGRRLIGRMRRAGRVPGVFYLHGEDPVALAFDAKTLSYFISHNRGLLDLQIEGEKAARKVVLKDVQYDPITENVLHVDFMGVVMGEKMTVMVALSLIGEPVGVKNGGRLASPIRELEVECLPKDIPEVLEVDISGLEIGDSIHIDELSFADVTILADGRDLVASVEMPRVVTEETEEADGEDGEAEGEAAEAEDGEDQ